MRRNNIFPRPGHDAARPQEELPRTLDRAIAFIQDILRIRSYSGEEQELAERVRQEMLAVGFDAAEIDNRGNVIGHVRGRLAGPGWLLVTHLDHVHEGPTHEWTHPPYEAALADGAIHGRGAVDIKGPLAAQVYALARLLERNQRPLRDVFVAAFTNEEVDGSGAAYAVPRLKDAVATSIIGEPSNNQLMLGHRGVAIVRVSFRGTAGHAGLASAGTNPHYAYATFLQRLLTAPRQRHPILGESTITPTGIESDSSNAGVAPGLISLTLDWRTTVETLASIRIFLEELTAGLDAEPELPEAWQPTSEEHSAGFYTDPNDSLVRNMVRVIASTLGSEREPGIWQFATDGYFTAREGIRTVGFGPGDPALAHTTRERIEVSALEDHVARLVDILNLIDPQS